MSYEKTVPFQGDFNKAAEVVKNTLLPHGFQILNTYENSIEMEGPNSVMSQNSEPLIGISWFHMQKTNSSLILKAELGGLKKTARILAIIIISALIIGAVVLGIIFSRQNSFVPVIPFIASFIILPIVIPLTFRAKKNQTIKTLDTLLNNMITLSN